MPISSNVESKPTTYLRQASGKITCRLQRSGRWEGSVADPDIRHLECVPRQKGIIDRDEVLLDNIPNRRSDALTQGRHANRSALATSIGRSNPLPRPSIAAVMYHKARNV